MRVMIFVLFFSLATLVWGQQWEQGVVTRPIWVDQGGYHVEIDGVPYLFMRDARIEIDGHKYELSDRMTVVTEKSKIRFVKDGFRIYDFSLEWRE